MQMITTTRKANPTIEYLKQATRAASKIIGLDERASTYHDLACRTTGRTEALRTGGTFSRSKLEDAVIRLIDLSDEKRAQASELVDKVREIEGVIAKVVDDRHRDLLTWRYLNGWTWERITEAMGREDVSWTHRLHGKALPEVEKIRKAMESNGQAVV